MKKIVIISLGGSLIVPKEGVNTAFLKDFRSLIQRHAKRGVRFVLICGGGSTCRTYQSAARSLGVKDDLTLDWIGIQVTRLNAFFVRTLFGNLAHPEVVTNPKDARSWKKPVLVVAGWKPGCSTDYDATLLARQLKTTHLINLSNIDYVYDKDPRVHKNAKPIMEMSWKELRALVGNRWDPGAHVPFDPIASRLAQKIGLEVIIADGRNIKNLDAIILGKKYIGTVIRS